MDTSKLIKNITQLKKQNKPYQGKTKVLGRGISALLGENSLPKKSEEVTSSKDNIVLIKIKDIQAGVFQPRKTFNDESIQELSQSIKQKGLLQPVLIRTTQSSAGVTYELISGERRFRAARLANIKEIPCVIKELSNKEALEVGLIENLQRENLNPIEEAEGFNRLIKEFGYTHHDLATILGKSRSYITNYLRLLNLPQPILNLIEDKKLSVGHAKIIVNFDFPLEIAEKIAKEKLSVREVEQLIKSYKEKGVEGEKDPTPQDHHNDLPKDPLKSKLDFENFSNNFTSQRKESSPIGSSSAPNREIATSLQTHLSNYLLTHLQSNPTDKKSNRQFKVEVKTKDNGSGFLKIAFKDINKLATLFNKPFNEM